MFSRIRRRNSQVAESARTLLPKIVPRFSNETLFFHGSIIGFALDFTYVAGHSDQCSKFSCGIPMLPASKAFTTVPMREDAKDSRWSSLPSPSSSPRSHPSIQLWILRCACTKRMYVHYVIPNCLINLNTYLVVKVHLATETASTIQNNARSCFTCEWKLKRCQIANFILKIFSFHSQANVKFVIKTLNFEFDFNFTRWRFIYWRDKCVCIEMHKYIWSHAFESYSWIILV